MKQLLFLFISLLFIGCSQEVPPVKQYRLSVEIPEVPVKSSICKDRSLKILSPSATYEYTTNKFYYVQGLEEATYTQSNWARIPVNDIYYLILNNIRKSAIFNTVENYTSIVKGDLNLEIEIQNFKQYFSKNADESYVIVNITLTLINKKHFKVISQQNFYKKVPTPSADAKGGVEAFNKALKELIPEMIDWLDGSCQ